jgi:hypothetical protein
VASDSERTDDSSWDDLEQGFFAAAPPDVPEPPAEAMRFDDLDPVAPDVSRHGRTAAVQRRLATWRAKAIASGAVARRRLTPAVGAAWVTSRRSARRFAVLARVVADAGRAGLPRLLAVLRDSQRRARVLAASVAALVAVTGVSAGVVASRGNGGGRTSPLPAQSAVASTRTIAAEIAPPPKAMTPAPDEDPTPLAAPIANGMVPGARTGVTTAGPRKRKQPKALSKSSQRPSAPPSRAR